MTNSLDYLEKALGLLGRHYGVLPSASPSFEFPIPDGLMRFYQCFADTSIFNGHDYLCPEPRPLGTDWYGVPLKPNLLQLAYENQAVWFLATDAVGGEDGRAYVINDVETIKYDSLNRYLAGFLLNQTVWNKGLNTVTEIPPSSNLWSENGFFQFSDGWSKPGHLGYESFQVSPDGQIIVGFDVELWAVIVSNVELPKWLTIAFR